MRNFLLGLPLSLFLAQAAFGDCLDTTIVLKSGAPGYTAATGVYDPDAAGAVNTIIAGCTDSSITVHLHIDPTQASTWKDTIKLANPIKITTRTSKTTALTNIKKSGSGVSISDTIFTFVENNSATPALLTVATGNRAVITNFGFARKVNNSSTHSVTLSGKGSMIAGCHFWMLDNTSSAIGALLDIQGDSILVDRCLFRAPSGGSGWSTAIHSSGSALKVEIRSCVFFSTGLQLTTGSYHIFANTFAGSRSTRNCITIGSSVATPGQSVVIQHNLFVPKTDLLPPIAFSGTLTSCDSIQKNAWSRSDPTLALAVNAAGASLTLNGATAGNANTPLSRGFSNYGPNAPDIMDFPLTELRTDSNLAANNADFGKVFRVYTSTAWTTMQDVKDGLPSTKLYFPTPSFTPFIAGRTWLANTKVGAFGDADLLEVPSPLDSGTQGSALKFSVYATDNTKITNTRMSFDQNYYKSNIAPEFMYYFFSNTLSKLTASNDSTTLKAAVGANAYIRKASLNDDGLLSVPKEVRTGGDIFVKMLHYRSAWQAPVLSDGAIATVVGVPSFPANDLVLSIVPPGPTDYGNGNVNLTVTHGTEALDSIRVVAAHDGGAVEATSTKSVTGTSLSFAFTNLPKGTYYFYAVPMAKLSGVVKLGQPTANSASISLHAVAGDTLYVSYKTGGVCTGADGSQGNPFCGLDSALKEISLRNGGIIRVFNASPAVAMEDVVINSINSSDTAAVLISNMISAGRYVENRPIFRGKAKEALVINRKNVTLKGFVIEMPAGSTGKAALSVKAGGAVIDGNIFRTSATSQGVEGPAVNIEVGNTAEVRFVNNVTWGITKAVQFTNSSSPGIRIMNNTFMDDKSVPNTGSIIGITGSGAAIGGIIANNFFSGITAPFDTSVVKKTTTIDHNVYSPTVNLKGLVDAGALDTNQAVRTVDLTSASYVSDLENALNSLFNCSSIHPCTSLQGASSTSDYNTPVTIDVMGKARTNKKEVGAYEAVIAADAVLGRLSIKASPNDTVFSKASFEVSSKNFDATEADSVHVWWTTTPTSTLDSSVPASNQAHYAIAKLNPGSIPDVATGLSEDTRYFFYASFGRNGAKLRTPGFVASDTLRTPINIQTTACPFDQSDNVCPSKTGKFVSVGGPWDRKFQTRVTLANKADAGSSIQNPTFISIVDPFVHNLNLNSQLPMISFDIKVASLGASGSSQAFTATIDMDNTPNLAGKELFLIPDDPNALPTHVATWDLVQDNGRTTLTIEGTTGGVLHYAFGKLADGVQPGQVSIADAAAPVFDYGDTASQVSFPITGTGFKTSNPLVLVSLVPAGGMSKNVIGGKYPANTVALSANISELPTDLRKDRFYRYYLKAAGAEASNSPPSGQNKPMTLDSVTQGAFDSSAIEDGPSVSLAPSGAFASNASISVPMSKKFKDAESGRKASRSVEVVFTVFDGSQISRTSGFIRTQFTDDQLQLGDRVRNLGKNQFERATWSLYGYPWDETETGSQARIVGEDKWDKDHMKLMKFKGTGTGAGSFTIADGASAASISFDAGQAVWGASAKVYEPRCVKGTSLDYRTFELALTGGQWNDISLPFNFPMKLKDILDSSNLSATPPAMFRYLDASKSWEALGKTSIIYPWDGLTVKPAANVTLKIPVLDMDRSTTSIATTKAAAKSENQWQASLEAYNGTASMALHIGKAGAEGIYLDPPNVPGQDFRMALKHVTAQGGEETLSQYVQSENGTWQGHWPLKASAIKGSTGLSLRVTDNSKSVPLYLVDALHQTVTALGHDSIRISEEDLTANDYHLVAGDAQYLDGILQSLSPAGLLTLSNYPNPFSGSTLIRYALPTSFGKVDFLLKVRDFRGRTVFEKAVHGSNSLNFIWDGKNGVRSSLPAGVYTLSLEAKAVGKPTFKATRRLLKM